MALSNYTALCIKKNDITLIPDVEFRPYEVDSEKITSIIKFPKAIEHKVATFDNVLILDNHMLRALQRNIDKILKLEFDGDTYYIEPLEAIRYIPDKESKLKKAE